MSEFRILEGDCLARLADLPDCSVQTCVTSPPYWGLRDYGAEGQLGLEPTPEQYVENMVAVFREVRRVLRDDGTLWLNLGDSYAAGGSGGASSKSTLKNDGRPVFGARAQEQALNERARTRPAPPGLKPKDLVGIPWAVAEALRDPYYSGRIRDERDRVWLAAMIDAEGCIFIHRRKAGQHNGQGYHRKADSFGSGLEVSNTNRRVVERCLEIAQAGSICEQTAGRKQTLYRWNLRTNECREILREVYPYLVAKQHEARLACGVPSSGKDATAAWEALKIVHGGGLTDVDFKPPASMFEQGYYLRSDIVWNKLNPMPESVTDRPTKAHEYLFLLTKGPRYFYDADAIREENAYEDRRGDSRVKYLGRGADISRNDGDADYFGQKDAGRNKRTVWTVATQPFPGAHFATFPPKLIEPCILAGSPPKCCGECGAPWERVLAPGKLDESRPQARRAIELAREHGLTEAHLDAIRSGGVTDAGKAQTTQNGTGRNAEDVARLAAEAKAALGGYHREFLLARPTTTGWQPTCEHDADRAGTGPQHGGPELATAHQEPRPRSVSTVLDPFSGAGTTGLVALRHDRDYIGIELNPEYTQMARDRILDDAPLLNVEALGPDMKHPPKTDSEVSTGSRGTA